MPSKNLIRIKDLLVQGAGGQAKAAAVQGIFYYGLIRINLREYSLQELKEYFANKIAFVLDDDEVLYIFDAIKAPYITVFTAEKKGYTELRAVFKDLEPQSKLEADLNSFALAKKITGREDLMLYLGDVSNEKIYIKDTGNTDPLRADKTLALIEEIASAAQRQYAPGQITRAITDEFSFYPKDTPYTLDEYKKIIAGVAEISQKLAPDIHLVLATFPVLWPNGGILHCGLHVQSPKNQDQSPILHHFSKQHHSLFDYQYTDSDGMVCEFTSSEDCLLEHASDVVLSGTVIAVNDMNQYGSAIKVTTADNKTFITTIGICLDHDLGVEREQVHGLIDTLQIAKQDIPFHCSHVITSSTIAENPKHVLSTLSHADPHKSRRRPIGRPDRNILLTDGMVSVFSNSRITIEVYEARTIATLHSDLLQHIMATYSSADLAMKINQRDEDGNTFLHKILEETEYDLELIIRRFFMLIAYGGDPDLKNNKEKSMRELAESIDSTEFLHNAINYTLSCRAFITLQNTLSPADKRNELTRLMKSMDDNEGIKERIKNCILQGANPFKKDGYGESALDIIKTFTPKKHLELKQLIFDTLKRVQEDFIKNVSNFANKGVTEDGLLSPGTQEPGQAVKERLEEIKSEDTIEGKNRSYKKS